MRSNKVRATISRGERVILWRRGRPAAAINSLRATLSQRERVVLWRRGPAVAARKKHRATPPQGERVITEVGRSFFGLLERAREMRMKATPAEAFAWGLFRDRQFLGLKFRRQHQIGNYIADFYCHEKRLVVELDGPVHDSDERRTMDRNRDAYLESLGMDRRPN